MYLIASLLLIYNRNKNKTKGKKESIKLTHIRIINYTMDSGLDDTITLIRFPTVLGKNPVHVEKIQFRMLRVHPHALFTKV